MRFAEVWPEGEASAIGSYHFTGEKIVEFARRFDPQYFHLDAERARESVLGGLCASGWHVCSAWMQLNVAFLFGSFTDLARQGITPPRIGPAMGVRELRWKAPVFAGNTITYTNTLVRQLPLANHRDRLLTEVLCEGTDQDGRLVISFRPQVIEFI